MVCQSLSRVRLAKRGEGRYNAPDTPLRTSPGAAPAKASCPSGDVQAEAVCGGHGCAAVAMLYAGSQGLATAMMGDAEA
jgi:hypothetical protein